MLARFACLICMGAFCVTAAHADEASDAAQEMFQKLDTNADGVLQPAEVTEQQRKFFERLVRLGDDNKDGALTAAEFQAALKPQPPATAPVQNGNAAERRQQVEQMFARMDRNGDGKVTLEELPEQALTRLKSVFERLGKDELTKDDFLRMAVGRGGNAATPQPPQTMDAMFARLDADNDGKVTLAEAPERAKPLVRMTLQRLGLGDEAGLTKAQLGQAFEQARRQQSASGRTSPGMPVFGQLDTDRNGRLSAEEIKNAPKVLMSLDRNGDGELSAADFTNNRPAAERRRPEQPRPAENAPGAGNAVAQLIARADTDKDGKLSAAELPERAGRLKDNFDRVDADGDGKLSAEELKRVFARMQRQ